MVEDKNKKDKEVKKDIVKEKPRDKPAKAEPRDKVETFTMPLFKREPVVLKEPTTMPFISYAFFKKEPEK